MPTVNTERGTRALFYTSHVEDINPGAGADTVIFKKGYDEDPSIAPGSYPNPEHRLTYSRALSLTAQVVRMYQSAGKKDVRGKMYGKVFGADAADPVRALTGSEDGPHLMALIDTPDPWLRRKISLANTPKNVDGDLEDGDGDHDVDNVTG